VPGVVIRLSCSAPVAKSTETSRLIVEDFERRWQPGIRAAAAG